MPDSVRDPLHDLLVSVRLVDRADVLQNRGASLETEAGVDVLLRERRQRAVGVELVRHKDEVPELEKAIAARARRCAVGLTAAVLLAPVVVDLRVGPARPGTSDRPEVLRGRQRHDPLRRACRPRCHSSIATSSGPSFNSGVAGVHRDPHTLPVELHVLLDTNSRRERDCTFLEVLPEREVAEHLEEREVVPVEPDLVDVDGPEDLLRQRRQRSGWWLLTDGRTASAAAFPQ